MRGQATNRDSLETPGRTEYFSYFSAALVYFLRDCLSVGRWGHDGRRDRRDSRDSLTPCEATCQHFRAGFLEGAAALPFTICLRHICLRRRPSSLSSTVAPFFIVPFKSLNPSLSNTCFCAFDMSACCAFVPQVVHQISSRQRVPREHPARPRAACVTSIAGLKTLCASS